MSIYGLTFKYCLLVPNEVDKLSSVRFGLKKISLTFKSKPSHLLDYWSNNTNDSTLDVCVRSLLLNQNFPMNTWFIMVYVHDLSRGNKI